MARILGTISSSFVEAGDFESIATVTVGSGGTSAISFGGIPQTFTHLQLRGFVKGSRTGSLDDMSFRFNSGDANITYHYLRGDGSSATAAGGTAGGWGYLSAIASEDATSIFTSFIIDILDYTNTNKYKTHRTLIGYDLNGSGRVQLSSGVQLTTSAITHIDFILSNTNFRQYSQIALYGIKGA